jgi:hypothetical protein
MNIKPDEDDNQIDKRYVAVIIKGAELRKTKNIMKKC